VPAEGGHDERRPTPARIAHAGRKPRRVAVQRDVAALRQAVQQGGGEFGEECGLGLKAASGRGEIQHECEAPRRRRGGAAGEGEGKQLEQVEGRHPAQAEPAKRRRRVHEDRRRHAGQMDGRLRRGQQQQFAIDGEDGGAAVAGNHGRRVGERNSRHVRSLDSIATPRHRPSHGGGAWAQS
jgi:hypothetical protein